MLSGGSHPFQDRLEVRRSEVLGLLYLAIQYVDIGIPLGHIRRMDLIEDRFEIDSVGVACPVDNVQEVREGIGNLHQIPLVCRSLKLSKFLSDQSYPDVPDPFIHKTRRRADEDSEPAVELLDHPLLRVHLYLTSKSFLPRKSRTFSSPKPPSIALNRFDHAVKRLTIRVSPHSGSISRDSSGSVVVIPTWHPRPLSQFPQCVQPTATASAVATTHPSAPSAIAFATSSAVLIPPLAMSTILSRTPSDTR